ncbi:MAG: iron chelate uptake ABC transporter family permease subunit [Paracoccaceae bacterium]
MLDDFLVRAVLAGIGLSLATGPLGAFVVWRKMAYFGDTIAHAAILGVALSLAFSMSPVIGTFVAALAVGIAASGLASGGRSMDSTLGVLSHSALALGLVAISFVRGVRVDLTSFLFGDILTVSLGHVGLIWLVSLGVLGVLVWRWSDLLTATLDDDLAASRGINPARQRLILTLALALVVALSLKIVGALLIGAMLIIPATAARGFSRSPEMMAITATVIGGLATLGGVGASALLDTPAGPSIVVVAALIFAISGRLRISET